jgi:hypothetical protein
MFLTILDIQTRDANKETIEEMEAQLPDSRNLLTISLHLC